MQSRQIDKKTKQIRICAQLHRELKIKAAKEGKTIKSLVENCLEKIMDSENG